MSQFSEATAGQLETILQLLDGKHWDTWDIEWLIRWANGQHQEIYSSTAALIEAMRASIEYRYMGTITVI